MTTSVHTYTAVLAGSPDIPLSVRGGSITISDANVPSVQADLEIALPVQATLTALDPRVLNRVRITANATFPSGTQTRVFDLGLRDRVVNQKEATVQLALASNEALADDYAPESDDLFPFNYQSSLRAIVNYALGTVSSLGAYDTLEAVPSADASMQTYADNVNALINPAPNGPTSGDLYVASNCTVDTNDTTWGVVGGRSYNLYASTNTDSYVQAGTAGALNYGMTAGGTYVFSATGNVKTAFTGTDGPNARRLVAYYRTGSGAYTMVTSAVVPNSVGVPTRVSVQFTLPAGTTEAFLRYYHGGAASAPGQIRWGGFRLSSFTGDPTDTSYYDGSYTATSGYSYAWTGTANASTTKRTALISRPVDALRWPAGKSAMDYLMPLVQVAGFRLMCDEAQKWTLRAIDYQSSGSLAVSAGVNLIDGDDAIRRNNGTWFDGQVTEYNWIDPTTGMRMRAVDAWGLVDEPTLTNYVRVDGAYLGPGRSQYAVKRAQGRGREVSATAVADWRANAEQPLEITFDGALLQTGKSSRVVFNLSRDEMTVTARTVDTPSSAWVLIPAGQSWTSQAVGASWVSESV